MYLRRGRRKGGREGEMGVSEYVQQAMLSMS